MSTINFNNTAIPPSSTLVPYFPEETELLNLAKKITNEFFLYVYPPVFGIGSSWNMLIIIYFIKTNSKNLRKMSSHHFLIVCLSTSDLFVSIGMTIPMYYYSHSESWKFGEFGCSIVFPFIKNACPMISTWILVLISFARYRSIVYPLHARISKRKYGLACLLILIFSCLSNIRMFLKTKLKETQDSSKCSFTGSKNDLLIQITLNYSLDSFIPLAIMLIFYYKMKKRMIAEEKANSFALNDQSRQRNRRALRIIKGLIFLFTVTVILVRLFIIYFSNLNKYIRNTNPLFKKIFNTFYLTKYPLVVMTFYFNNILNIFIYAKMIPGFRRFLLTVFTFGLYGRRNAIN